MAQQPEAAGQRNALGQDHLQSLDEGNREVMDDAERGPLWEASAAAFPPYNEYQEKTDRKIPVFIAEPV